jgi:hypothetical protein
MTENERELLVDIIQNTESPEKVLISLDSVTRNVTVVILDCDDQDFKELAHLAETKRA